MFLLGIYDPDLSIRVIYTKVYWQMLLSIQPCCHAAAKEHWSATKCRHMYINVTHRIEKEPLTMTWAENASQSILWKADNDHTNHEHLVALDYSAQSI